MDEKAAMTFRLEAAKRETCEQECDRVASVLKYGGHKNGHNSQIWAISGPV